MPGTCIVPGWGTGPYGREPWGGSLGAVPGGPLPTVSPFDIYCVGPCGPMSVFNTYTGVEEYFQAGQVVITFPEEDSLIRSGGGFSTATARFFINHAVPSNWTFEFTAKFTDLPNDFSSLTTKHVFLGVSTPNDYCAGLFFSLVGLVYTGSVRHDGAGNLLVNSTVQILPSSLNLVQEDTYYTIRIAVDGETQTTFIYVTESILLPAIGHQLRYILPAIPGSASALTPLNGTTISVRGTAAAMSAISIDSICLSSALVIPNIPPIANAGHDQSIRTCTVARLDGSLSFDPEGSNILYKWRLIDAPNTSVNVVIGDDGATHLPAPFTNKFYSQTLGVYEAAFGIDIGDVLLLDAVVYNIATTGTDVDGFFVQVDSYAIPANQVAKTFKLLKQNGISGVTEPKPTFYPDVPGIYRFVLVVFDGQLFSPTSESILNVVESPVPRGIIPDMSFLWDYLSNFWKLVDNKDQFTTFWSSLAQITATEILTLWQTEYSKSIRDIQRTFQRRWLHYDTLVKEPLVAMTSVRGLYRGVLSASFVSPIVNAAGKTLQVLVPGQAKPIEVLVQGVSLTVTELKDQLRLQLRAIDARFDVFFYQNTVSMQYQLHIMAPFYFELAVGSSLPMFIYPGRNDLARGAGGAAVALNTYHVTQTLQNVDIKDGDYLLVDEVAYRIQRVVSSVADGLPSMRVVLYDELPVPAGANWIVVGATSSVYVDFYEALITAGDTAFYEVLDSETQQAILVPTKVLSATQYQDKSCLFTELTDIGVYLSLPARYQVYWDSVFRRTYLPVDPLVIEIPILQEKIVNSDDSAILRQNVDYFIEEFRGKSCIRFITGPSPDPDIWQYELPPRRMWAETTYIDNNPVIEQNFGIPADFSLRDLESLSSNSDYLSIVRGLWYSYFNGPTLHNLRVGSQLLLGLPMVEEAGTILEIRNPFSVTVGRLLIQSDDDQQLVKSYMYPVSLSLETNPDTGQLYKVGDKVKPFAPLVKGVEILDYIKDPKWFAGYLQQGDFLEVEKFFRFLVRVDSAAFSLNTLLFVKKFILRVKPTYTFPMFVVELKVRDATVDVTDIIQYHGDLLLFDTPCNIFKGLGMSFDDPSPGGGWMSGFDSAAPILPPPVYPTPATTVYWGYDRNLLCPQDFIVAQGCMILAVPTLPTLDGLFMWDSGLFSDTLVNVGQAGILAFHPAPAGLYLGAPVVAAGVFVVDSVDMLYECVIDSVPHSLRLILVVNGVDVRTINFVVPAWAGAHIPLPVGPVVNIAPGDVIRLRLEVQGLVPEAVPFASVTIRLGTQYFWVIGVPVPPGTYCANKLL